SQHFVGASDFLQSALLERWALCQIPATSWGRRTFCRATNAGRYGRRPLSTVARHRRTAMVDIHNYDQQYRSWEARVRNAAISERNRELIFAYRDACLLHRVCGKVRLIRAFQILVRCAELLGQDFDTVHRRDIERLVRVLMEGERKPSTVCTYQA